MSDDDTVGKPIHPSDLSRVTGERFISLTQLIQKTNLTKDQAARTLELLIEHNLFEAWIAAECPNCEWVWPTYKTGEEINAFIYCPICNQQTPVEEVPFYEVYKIIRVPPWMS